MDALIAALASAQHGVVGRSQLVGLGVGRRAIGHRVERGRLHLVHRGVYAVGHRALSRHGRWMAAVLAAGPGAVLSHRSAAALFGIRPTTRTRIDVTTPRTLHARSGIHPRCAVLSGDEITTKDHIPTTTPSRTLLDLAADLDRRALERAINEAEAQRLMSPTPIETLIARHPAKRGTAKLRTLLRTARSATRSELEARFLTFVDSYGLPEPETNVVIEEMEVDAAWLGRRVIVELDGYAFHGTRNAVESDRARDRRLTAKGWRVIRITWRDLHERPNELSRELRALL